MNLRDIDRRGLWMAIVAFLLWGVMPLWWHMPNRKNAVTTDSSVSSVRVLERNKAAQMRWKYFIARSRYA